MSEAGVIAVLFVVIASYTLLTPAMTDAQYNALSEEVGYYVAPTAGAVMTFLSALWATRKLTSACLAHGMLVGVASVLLAAGFIVSARPEHRLMYVIAFALRLLAGCMGGVVAQWMSNARVSSSASVN
jgi:putative membrane protein (TIGR04086 family)